jgi:hypothetical protein
MGTGGDVLSASVSSLMLHVLLAWAVVLLISQLFARVFARLGQPAVVGEMFAGVALGPSLVGRLFPDAATFLFPAWIAPQLELIAQIGVILFLFVVGLELDLQGLRARAGTALVISSTGIAVPLLLGSLVAAPLHARLGPTHVSTFVFGAFFCVAIAVTAFPVLARISSRCCCFRCSSLSRACAHSSDCSRTRAIGGCAARSSCSASVPSWAGSTSRRACAASLTPLRSAWVH